MEHDAEGESISRLLADVAAQREEAARFARLVEQSAFEGRVAVHSAAEDAGEEPPPSFVVDYAHALVDSYRPAKPPARIFGRGRTRRRLRAQAAAAVAVAPAAEPAEPLRLAAGGSRQIEKDCTERDDAAENISDSFVAKIDRPARALLWSRFACGEPRADEQHVAALVHKAERMTLAAEAIQSPVEAPQSPVEAPQSSIVSSPSPATKMPHFLPDEWLHWAAFIGDTPARAPLDPHEMQRRLAWAHDQQPDAWRHGFRDHPHRGKLLRTYPGLSVELHAYADGNLKRCVAGHSTTLFFANGDWQCDVREPQVGYYYYCAERVWCCQRSDGSVEYRYDDGRVERVDARGSSTVTYRSGEVVVQLGAHAG